MILIARVLPAQQVEWDASRILLEIQKLNQTASVLYIAAHPDDENTRLIAYLVNDQKVRTGYLSLTRGDGGQNLLGDEQGAVLGVIRTEELLQARKTDGGEQYFTRAVDFGYSKSAAETFSKWNYDSLLSDVVWVIRNFRPDIIITRFPPDARAGHGQHTVSALLAEDAFSAAADPTRFPEQLHYVSVWQAQRLYWNNSTWWDKDLPQKISSGDPDLISLDDGGYNVLLGKSDGEIAADSRSHHKSQGFGSTPSRQQNTEYLELRKGRSNAGNSIFGGIPIGWERYPGGAAIGKSLDSLISAFNPLHPENSVPGLLAINEKLGKLPQQDPLIRYKEQQLQNIIIACLGLWIEPIAEKEITAYGDSLQIFSSVILRSDFPVKLRDIRGPFGMVSTRDSLTMELPVRDTMKVHVTEDMNTTPYWLREPYGDLFDVPDQRLIGKAENDPPIIFSYDLQIGGKNFSVNRAVAYKETDPVKGEVYYPITIVDPLTVSLSDALMVFPGDSAKTLRITVTCHSDFPKQGLLTLQASGDTHITPASYALALRKGESQTFAFSIAPGKDTDVTTLSVLESTPADMPEPHPKAITGNPLYTLTTIDYAHIPKQVIAMPAQIRVVSLHAEIPKLRIAYVEGAGDKVDESLQEIGLMVDHVKAADLTAELLMHYDVVLIGVRAYNTNPDIVKARSVLLHFMAQGGLVLDQYNTTAELMTDSIGPYPFTITHGRVTNENSPVRFADPKSVVFNDPNVIRMSDFDGWVQERGLYFAENAAPEYRMPLFFRDPDEKEQGGSLLIADYGKGAFIYTGISFFRELPAGVPGAYRLFINLLSYRQTPH